MLDVIEVASPQSGDDVLVAEPKPMVANPVADVLERAALYIEEFGWVQGYIGDRTLGFCGVGGIYMADTGSERGHDGKLTAIGDAAHRALCSAVGLKEFQGFGTHFNDTPGRTAHEVTAALREAARRVREAR